MSDAAITVTVENRSGREVDESRWAGLASEALAAEGVVRGHLDLTFVTPEEIADLKRQDLDGDGSPTDVLAYPLDADEGRTAGDGPPVLLGDIVVCPQQADSNATTHGVGEAAELELLIVHAVLHLLGHDHAEPDEEAVMRERERVLLGALARGPAHPRLSEHP